MDEVVEVSEPPRRNRRGAAVAAGALVVVAALLALWLVTRDDPNGVDATTGEATVAAVYSLPEDADLADMDIDEDGVVTCDCELDVVGSYPLVSEDMARAAVMEGRAFVLGVSETTFGDVSNTVAKVRAATWSGTNVIYVVPTWRFTDGDDTIEVLAIDPDVLFAPPASTTTTTTEGDNASTTVPVDETTATSEPPSSAAKGVLRLHMANTTNKPVEFFFETTDGASATSVVVEGGESGEATMTVLQGCVEFRATLGVGAAGATQSVIVGREPVDVHGGYVPTRTEQIQLGLELPDSQVGCAG